MKVIVKIILIGLIAYFLSQAFVWWTIALAAFMVCCIIPSEGFKAFIAGFLGIGLLWYILAFITNQNTEALLSHKVSELIGLGDDHLLVLATALVGGIVGGFSALSGVLFRKLFQKEKRRYY